MKTRKRDTRWLVLLALFVAIEIFLNVTGIGLIPLPLIKASTLHIPVIIGAVLNILLDPLFIFVFRMGVKGAALATILSQAVSACGWWAFCARTGPACTSAGNTWVSAPV